MKKIWALVAMLAIFIVGYGARTVFAQSAQAYTSVPSFACASFTRNMYHGLRDKATDPNSEIMQLQQFLHDAGYLNYVPTGFFGPLTKTAVQAFQKANGLSADGYVGAMTRAKLHDVACGTKPNQSVSISSIAPSTGPVGTEVTVTGSGFTAASTIKFGTGAINTISFVDATTIHFTIPAYMGQYCAPGMYCIALAQQVTAGVYPVTVMNLNNASNAVDFTVTSGTLADVPTITSMTPSSGPIGTLVTITGSNFTHDTIVHFGIGMIGDLYSVTSDKLSFIVPSVLGPYCNIGTPCPMFASKVTAPGTYAVSVSNSNGVSDTINFDVTDSTSDTISISGIDAPTDVPMRATGTWTVHVTASHSGTLHYGVVWGDEWGEHPYVAGQTPSSVQTTATFTHSYAKIGHYTAHFTVTDDNGNTATASVRVNVTGL